MHGKTQKTQCLCGIVRKASFIYASVSSNLDNFLYKREEDLVPLSILVYLAKLIQNILAFSNNLNGLAEIESKETDEGLCIYHDAVILRVEENILLYGSCKFLDFL